MSTSTYQYQDSTTTSPTEGVLGKSSKTKGLNKIQALTAQYTNAQVLVNIHSPYQDPERAQIPFFFFKKTIDVNTKMTGMLELYGKDLKAAMMKMLPQAIANAPEAK